MSTAAFCPICSQQVSDQMMDGAGWCPDHGRVFVDYTRPVPPVIVHDTDGMEIRKGMVVLDRQCREEGVVLDVVAPAADYTDDGTPVSSGPRVVVEYGDVVEQWPCTPGRIDGYVCDDVTVRP